ncbi:hypothetical protein NDU88_004056 [Pleurodeles waltl]|uniref:Uncharacterized protein n=1 Tax=Pleurodeles waltl TaxID=8319 RepID=A0AAV7QGL5_PLEWA|nr:hypothetical protein NDU88_004056 [Pleurodeles waltl]
MLFRGVPGLKTEVCKRGPAGEAHTEIGAEKTGPLKEQPGVVQRVLGLWGGGLGAQVGGLRDMDQRTLLFTHKNAE